MNFNHKGNPNLIPEYLTSLIKLSQLQQMTDHLDDELADSQNTMMNIQNMFDSIPKAQNAGAASNVVKPEESTDFLARGPPQLLMEDMTANKVDVDLDGIIATMKAYAQDLRRDFVAIQSQPAGVQRSITNLDLAGYAMSLDQLVKSLANVKLNKYDEASRNIELEKKLDQLCKDVNMFTQMAEAKKAVSEANANWTPIQNTDDALYCGNIINKLLAGINEVTYLLRNDN